MSYADNSLPEMIFGIGISAGTTQPSLNEHEQQAHTKLRWEHTQKSISNQPKAQAGHAVTPHCPQSQAPGTAANKQIPTSTNKVRSWGTPIVHEKKILNEKRMKIFKAKMIKPYKCKDARCKL